MSDAEPNQPERRVRFRVRRQDAGDRPSTRRWEELSVTWAPRLTIAGALRRIERVSDDPVTWEHGCLDGDCGACAMRVDGHVRQVCTTFVDDVSPKGKPITLEPLSKFPVVRDLLVDRSELRAARERVRAWLDLDATVERDDLRVSRDHQRLALALARCSDCGACLEACPQWSDRTDFVGASALNDVRRLALHPTGALQRRQRLEAVMAPGGIADCGKAQNCVEVCPMGIPLVDSLQSLSRETSKHLLFGWLFG